MLNLFGAFICFFLILVILFKIPQADVGLASFSNKSNLLGSPRSAERLLNIMIGIGILIYLVIAFKLNLNIQK